MSSGNTLAALRELVKGGGFGGTVNNNAPTPSDAGAARDFDGKVLVAPWMVSRGTPWNSCAAPAAKQAMTDWVDRLLAAGATHIQFDDPGMQFDSAAWGVGDFSASNLAGFKVWIEQRRAAGLDTSLTPAQAGNYRDWLQQNHQLSDNSDYIKRSAKLPSTALWRAYLQESVYRCVADIRSHLLQRSQGRAALSFNLYTPYPWSANSFLQPLADYIVSEVASDHRDWAQLQFMGAWLRAEGQRWAPVFPGHDKAALRRNLVMTYAAGGTPIAPWDVYVPPEPGQSQDSRFFGQPPDFADIFQFVRQQAGLFDGWQTLSRLNLLAYRDPETATQSLAQLKRLAALHVPYAVVLHNTPSGGDGLAMQRPRSLTLRSARSKLTTNDDIPLAAQASDANLASLAVATDVTPNYSVVVKGNPRMPGRRVLHLFREAGSAASVENAGLQFTLTAWVLPGQDTYQLKLHQPGIASSDLGRVRVDRDKRLHIKVPAIAEWALLELKPI
jgi:hypothetical protein